LGHDGFYLANLNEGDFQNLSIESCNPGGWTVASFQVPRDIRQYWEEFCYKNWVLINEGAVTYYYGFINKVRRTLKPDMFELECQGWSAQLNELGTQADITAGGGGYLASTFITSVILADLDSYISQGTIETDDYSYPNGTSFEFSKWTSYFDCLEQLNQGNNYDWGVWENAGLSFTKKAAGVIDWYIRTDDCNDLEISYDSDKLCNRLVISYTQDGSHQQSFTLNDTASQIKYGVLTKLITIPGKIITGSTTEPYTGAYLVGHTYLDAYSTLQVAAQFTTKRVYDTLGVEQHLAEVKAGQNIQITDWLPTEEAISAVNDIATFQIKATKYDHSKYTLDITPTEFIPAVEIKLARLEATGY
jgi:hypothetical protein